MEVLASFVYYVLMGWVIMSLLGSMGFTFPVYQNHPYEFLTLFWLAMTLLRGVFGNNQVINMNNAIKPPEQK